MKGTDTDVRSREVPVPLHPVPSTMFQFKKGVRITLPDWAIKLLQFDNHGPWPQAPMVLWARRVSEANLDLIICGKEDTVRSHRIFVPTDVKPGQLLEIVDTKDTDACAKHVESV